MFKKTVITLWLICLLMIFLGGCAQQEGPAPVLNVDQKLSPSYTAEPIIEEAPNKNNNYGFSGNFLSIGNVMVYYPMTDHIKDALATYKKEAFIEKELQFTKPKNWMLLTSENRHDAILIEIDKTDIKVLLYEEGQLTPSMCKVSLGDGNFLNFSKIIAYKKNEVLYISSEYPSSSAYEALYFHKKGKEIKLLENRHGDKVLDSFENLRNHIANNETEEAILDLNEVVIAYPELYLNEIIDMNKLFFYHLSEKAKRLQETDVEKSLEYYQLALQLVIMTEISTNDNSAYLAYDVAMKLSEENPEVASQLIDNKNIAEVLNRYIKLLKYKEMPVNEYLQDLSKILNNSLK